MITFKLGNLIPIIQTFNKFIYADLPIVLSFNIAKILKKLGNEEMAYNTARKKLCEKYGEYDENGKVKFDDAGILVVREDMIDEYKMEFAELMSVDVKVDCERIPLSVLNDAGIKLSPVELLAIEEFIKSDM